MANPRKITQATKTPKAVSVAPEVTLEKTVEESTLTPEQLEPVTIRIDRMMTDGGIRINLKLYVGEVTVPRHIANDLMRIQEEYFETKQKLMDPNVSVRMKSDFQKEVLFLADPKEHGHKATFTRDYGLLPLREWEYCAPAFKEHLLVQRKQLYGY